jgi:hypothetical protein
MKIVKFMKHKWMQLSEDFFIITEDFINFGHLNK